VSAEGRKWFLACSGLLLMKILFSRSSAFSFCPLVRVKLGPILIETLKG
jgi:hypothetical protein